MAPGNFREKIANDPPVATFAVNVRNGSMLYFRHVLLIEHVNGPRG
jgi:hypothetical protein